MELAEQFGWEGRTIACGRAGTGPDVVFCHGTPFSSRVWSRYADELAEDYTVHLWDMPGYGESSMQPDHRVDFDHQGKALAALIQHWELERPHVVAHDFGGATALRAHLIEGTPYASLFLTDVVAIPPSGSPFFRFVQDNQGVLDELPGYIHEAIVRTYIQGAAHSDLDEADLAQLVAPWLSDTGRPAFYRQIGQYDERFLVEIEDALPGLDCPTTVVWGSEDTWIPTQTGRRLAELASAPYAEVPGAGHLIEYDAPVALMGRLARWLGEQTAS